MKYMTSAEIRESYLKFFEEKGCKRMPSSSLIPDDPSLLLTSAGMVQFKPYFLQQKKLDDKYIGATTSQKCVRTNDINIIGTTGRHLSFFEMLGNFSFGKYFKKEMCAWALEFSLNVLELDKDKLYFTVFEEDDETEQIWLDLGIDPAHLSRLGEDDNFWRAGPTGPCGPCSEIYYDMGEDVGCGKPDCKPGCDCDRYVEYWNCVFTQYDAQEDGSMPELPFKNIDTGMGLERMAAIMQGVKSNYETDVLRSLISVGERLSGKKYGENSDVDLALRIMADHSRAITFMIADGILPSNEGRGYVLRRLLRRAIMKGNHIGINGKFLNNFVDEIVNLMGDVYPEIVENRELERSLIEAEEERFGATLHSGQAYLEEALKSLKGNTLSGKVAFKLHDTYGFPLEVTIDICENKGIRVDCDEFNEQMELQKNRARSAGSESAEAAWSTYGGIFSNILNISGKTEFVGYNNTKSNSIIKYILKDGDIVDSFDGSGAFKLVLDKTPFYAEMGGQVGDTGTIKSNSCNIRVLDTTSPESGLIVHTCELESGVAKVDDSVICEIDITRRKLVERNHSATHLLHKALQQVLGEHVKQAGSYVGPDRLRFDFTHFEKTTKEQLSQVEDLVNQEIIKSLDSHIFITSLTEARNNGITALFGEKYGEEVRVVELGQYSKELCGGCHVKNTSEIGLFKIVNETSVGANIRRVEALTSLGALNYFNRVLEELQESADELRVPLFDVSERIAANVKYIYDMKAKKEQVKEAYDNSLINKVIDKAYSSKAGYKVVIYEFNQLDAGSVRAIWDIIKSKIKEPVACVLGGINEDKPILMAAGTDDAIELGFSAINIIKNISGIIQGGGGGKDSMAQAGGKDANKIGEALHQAKELLE